MYQKMMILLTCLATVSSVAEALVAVPNITETTAVGLEVVINVTISECVNAIDALLGTNTGVTVVITNIGNLLITLLGTLIASVLAQVLTLLIPLLSIVPSVVVGILLVVLGIVVEVVNLVIELLTGVLTIAQCVTDIEQWFANATISIGDLQNGTQFILILGLVQGMVSEVEVALLSVDGIAVLSDLGL